MNRVQLLGGAVVALFVAACAERVDTAWHDETGYRWRQLGVPARGRDGFTPIGAGTSGITHANIVDDEHALANRNLIIGAGVAAADVDGDGLVDLFLAAVERPGALYRNEGGMRFADVTTTSGIDLEGRATTGAAFADVDGDRDPDLIVGTLGGPLCLFRNDGNGRFSDVTTASGLDSGFAATTLTLADVEGDGDLDLYVATYKVRNALDAFTPQARAFDQVVKKINGVYQVLPEWAREFRIEDRPDLGGIVRSQRAERDLFYLNDGTGHFEAQALAGPRWRDEDGTPLGEAPDYFSLAARFYDVNGDGAPDLYVCNDFEDPDQFWLNDRTGGFQLVPRLAVRATSNTCMSVDFADVNRDGAVDFFTADMLSPGREARQRQIPTHTPLRKTIGESADRAQWMRNALQLARGDGTWAQVGDFAGVAATDWTWGSAFVDVDLDGFEDLLLAVGHRWDVRDADTYDRIRNAFPRVAWNREQGEFPRLAVPSIALRNTGDLTFADHSRAWRFGTDSAIAHGIALADLDGDGDQDAVVTRLGQPPALYRNESAAPRIAVRLVGRRPNTQAIGAVVTVRALSLPAQSREVSAGGSYLSASDPLLTFATGKDSVVTLEVRWRDGRLTRIDGAGANRLYEVDEATSPASSPADPLTRVPALFADETPLLGGHRHTEPMFDDFGRQPLLPNRFSQSGPGVTWIDVDGDEREDLVVGAGKTGGISLLRNTPRGFVRADGPPAAGDLGSVLPVSHDGAIALLAAQSNYEATSPAEAAALAAVVSYPVRAGRPGTPDVVVAADSASMGPMALGDVNGDGLPDLFVGARVVPGAWPLPAHSKLLRGFPNGRFAPDSALAGLLPALGLVTAAAFADLNGDGRADLVVATEWGPLRVLLNEGGRLRDATSSLGLAGISSRWRGVSAGDFDGDGALDLVATSWGRNIPWRASETRPYALLVGRFGTGVGLLFAQSDSLTGKEMPLESLARLGVAMPDVRERIGSYAEYARADVDAVLGVAADSAIRIGATTFDHMLFLNRGPRFEARPLPPLAQLAPASAPVVADFDGDGREDLFLSQNFFPTDIGTMRFDAGAGLILMGDGAGGFAPLSVRASGVSVLGDQRGAATADYNGDGRLDLALAQNGAETRLFRNTTGRPGLRVRLDGGPGNPLGIGTQLRIITGAKRGPVREVRAGGGYWSMDSPVTVIALPDEADSLWIRWPGGVVQTVALVKGGRELRVLRGR
ncbi:MAG: FG-GAP-like repeat-containing protein [Gemmatimonadaceae bacterium]